MPENMIDTIKHAPALFADGEKGGGLFCSFITGILSESHGPLHGS